MKSNNFHIILICLILGSCSRTHYWSSRHCNAPYTPPPVEINVNETRFTRYEYYGTGCLFENSGSGEMRKSELKGDTILVYDYRPMYTPGDSINFQYKSVLYEAYLKKNRKLYFIYSNYPLLDWMQRDTTPIDSSRIQKATVNWEGWSTGEVYVDLEGDYFKKGKNRPLRRQLRKKFKENDSTAWHLALPNLFFSDTIIIRSYTEDKLGPLKNGGF
ncbi:MAG: hypothetical protein GQ574_16305 [Crocinitomix sp.]|nr:hypothetical protein [Crocinitomix sp.]